MGEREGVQVRGSAGHRNRPGSGGVVVLARAFEDGLGGIGEREQPPFASGNARGESDQAVGSRVGACRCERARVLFGQQDPVVGVARDPVRGPDNDVRPAVHRRFAGALVAHRPSHRKGHPGFGGRGGVEAGDDEIGGTRVDPDGRVRGAPVVGGVGIEAIPFGVGLDHDVPVARQPVRQRHGEGLGVPVAGRQGLDPTEAAEEDDAVAAGGVEDGFGRLPGEVTAILPAGLRRRSGPLVDHRVGHGDRSTGQCRGRGPRPR
jgi:hypothetical protein